MGKPVAREVVVLPFPQTDLQPGKRRPALVVEQSVILYIAAKITLICGGIAEDLDGDPRISLLIGARRLGFVIGSQARKWSRDSDQPYANSRSVAGRLRS